MYAMGMWCGWCGAKARNPDFLPTLTALNGSRGGVLVLARHPIRLGTRVVAMTIPGTVGAGPFKSKTCLADGMPGYEESQHLHLPTP